MRRAKVALGIVAVMVTVVPNTLYAQRKAIDSSKSTLTIRVFKSGVFSAFAHDHEIRAQIREGEIDSSAHPTVQLRVDSGKMRVLDPDISEDDRAKIQHTMVGAGVLDIQAIANTAGFHMPTIEQGGNSLYPSMAQRASSVEVLRILISIGPTETMHFQTWSDKAGNAPPLTDPTNGLVFPDLNAPPFGGEEFQTNLIMPEPCPFLSRKLPRCSIIPLPRQRESPWEWSTS